MKRFQPLLLITGMVMMLPSIASANAGPAILWRFGFHLVVLTWVIGIGEGFLLCALFRTWKSWIFVSMIAANFTSALLGMVFVKIVNAFTLIGDVTIENLIPAFWTMVYVTFALTVLVEFPFFLGALYGRKWLVPKAVAATLLANTISYTLLFNWYTPDYGMTMVTKLEVVPASVIAVKEDYSLYYISPDGKRVLKSDLAGNDTEVIAKLDMDGVPDRLCACPRKVIEETKDRKYQKTAICACWESEFDLYVLMDVQGVKTPKLLLEDFSPRSALQLRDGLYEGWWDIETRGDFGNFRSFGDAENWEFYSEYWGLLTVTQVGQEDRPYSSAEQQSAFGQGSKKSINASYMVHTPFTQWPIRNGTNVAGKYGVFKLGKDQICILDPEKKRIALIARGFGPVVAKPPLKATPEDVKEQTANAVP